MERRIYLTEDESDGAPLPLHARGLPRPGLGAARGRRRRGAARRGWTGPRCPTPAPSSAAPTRDQVAGTRRFRGGEGIWYDGGIVYFSTKGDNVIWAYDTRTRGLDKIYDRAAKPQGPLSGVDNVTVSASGDIYVCEDETDEHEKQGGILDLRHQAIRVAFDVENNAIVWEESAEPKTART